MITPTILDCTLRDGSYAVQHQFTAEHTRALVTALDALGFPFVEVGHGLGLGACELAEYTAREVDEAHMRAAAQSVRRCRWGMFCIPSFARLSHVDLAAGYGMGFIRIGTLAEQFRRAEPYIGRARRHGMVVCANFMKSYATTPRRFAECAAAVTAAGADIVYIVDSAGGMLPRDVEEYVGAVRERPEAIRLGFHGHDNLGLAVANSLRAAELGVEFIDVSLQGLGRSAGNTRSEQLLCALLRSGLNPGIDPIAVMDAGERHVRPFLERKTASSSVDLVAGLAQFHSSFLAEVERAARRHGVDPRRLILSVGDRIRTEIPAGVLDTEARRLRTECTDADEQPDRALPDQRLRDDLNS